MDDDREVTSTVSLTSPKHRYLSRPNTVEERQHYKKKRRQRKRLEAKSRNRFTLAQTVQRLERDHHFPSVKEISWNELKPFGSNPDATLGYGKFGRVQIKTWRSMIVAVKTVSGANSAREIISEAYHLELCNKYKLHPNILCFLGISIRKNSSQASIITEFCMLDGASITLGYVLSHKPNTIPDKPTGLSLVHDITNGLNHIHKCGVLHNDLHPGNILIKRDIASLKLAAVIADFGLSSTFTTSKKFHLHQSRGESEEQARNNFRKRHPHVAPEVIGRENPTEKSDIYSLGYLMKAFTFGLPEIHDDVKLMYRRCLDELPQNRPTTSVLVSIIPKID